MDVQAISERSAEIALQAAQLHEALSKVGLTEAVLMQAQHLRDSIEILEAVMRVELNPAASNDGGTTLT